MPLKSSYKRTTGRKRNPGLSRKGKKSPGLGSKGPLNRMSKRRGKKRGRGKGRSR